VTAIKLRPYQVEAIEWLKAEWEAGRTRVPLVMATGAGKTTVFTHPTLLDEFLDAGKRVLIVAHTDELIEQAAKRARLQNPGRTVGIVKATQNQPTSQIVVSSRQTLLGERRRSQIRNVGLIIIDEAHHAIRTNTYGKILEHYGAFTECSWPDDCSMPEECSRGCKVKPNEGRPPRVLVAGFTATLARGDREKLSSVWQSGPDGKIFSRDILYFIRRGFLLDVRGEMITIPDFTFAGMRMSGGDFKDSDLADELERTFAPEIVAREYKARAVSARTGELRKGIAFWPLVATAERGAEAFNALGIRSEVIHGDTTRLSKTQRRAMLQRLHTGETQVVHGVGVLTEGFDEPTVDVVVMARPTRSAPLYQQCVGRVLRPNLEIPAEHREKALILDVSGAGARNDLRSLIDLAPERSLADVELDGGSLLELDDEWLEQLREQEELAAEAGGGSGGEFAEDYVGDTAVIEFDPLGRANAWGQTAGGTWFIKAGSVGYVFLVPSVAGEPSHYDIVKCSKYGWPKDGIVPWMAMAGDEYVDLPMDMALGWAEEIAIEIGGHGTKRLVSRKSAWRKEPASVPQQLWAKRRGLDITGMTKGEVNEMRDGIDASDRIDPMVRAVQAAASDA
jgi:superfamily II DNA or RNA helicase